MQPNLAESIENSRPVNGCPNGGMEFAMFDVQDVQIKNQTSKIPVALFLLPSSALPSALRRGVGTFFVPAPITACAT